MGGYLSGQCHRLLTGKVFGIQNTAVPLTTRTVKWPDVFPFVIIGCLTEYNHSAPNLGASLYQLTN
jgi:hypothetical protein